MLSTVLPLKPVFFFKAAVSMPLLLLLIMARTVPVADSFVGFLAIVFLTGFALTAFFITGAFFTGPFLRLLGVDLAGFAFDYLVA